MKASETRLSRIIEGTNQYLVPHFQRPYSWAQKNWDTLWSDLQSLYEATNNNENNIEHFMGAIVTAPALSVPEGVTKYLLIDGQQRLTTLLIILIAIRDRAKLLTEEKLSSKINDLYIINRYHDGLDQFKLLPTQGYNPDHSDRTAFIELVNGNTSEKGAENVYTAYKHFSKIIKQLNVEDIELYANIILTKLFLVSIVLEKDDNPYTIFESLNAKGQPLTQSDLVRNYFFMCIESNNHDDVYLHKWVPMEQLIGREYMEPFVRHYLIKDGSFVKESDVYYRLKKKVENIGTKSAIDVLNDLVKFSGYYASFLYPEKEQDEKVKNNLERILRFRVTVSYPFLLNVFNDRANGKLNNHDINEILEIIENFIVRRYICGTIRAELNELFTTLYDKANRFSNFIQGVKDVLTSRNYPSDQEFFETLQSKKLYSTAGDVRERAKIILERIESSWSNKESVNTETLTIEHIMPQTLTDSWREYLGETAEDTHDIYLHTLGNLTLTGYNAELSNLDFTRKKDQLRQSKLIMNQQICENDEWKEAQIKVRAKNLANRALQIWPSISTKQDAIATKYVTGTIPKQVFIMGQIYGISSWQEVLKLTLSSVAEFGDDIVEQLVYEFPRYINYETTSMRNPKQLTKKCYYEAHMNAEQIHRICIQVSQLAGLSSTEWYVKTE